MSDSWKPIYLSAKVFGHLSQGLYRTPAGAIKELISNSFDADAKLVRIHTGFPRFEMFSCEDNGAGMSHEEFLRLMKLGIGSSFKRTITPAATAELNRPLIGRLGLGILSLAQICTQFEIVSHNENTRTAFRATIKFPPYTREEMDHILRSPGDDRDDIPGGEYRLAEETYDASKKGLRIFTKYLRESFRKRMRSISRLANKRVFGINGPYRTFAGFLDAIYHPSKLTQSLNLSSDYDQLLFGLALAAPLPYIEDRNLAIQLPQIRERHAALKSFNFQLKVDNLSLANPVCLPSDRSGHTANQCSVKSSERRSFDLLDGPWKEECEVIHYNVTVQDSDERFSLYELRYLNESVAGRPLRFDGYLFQQTGRLYPRDIQGVLLRLSNVAIGKYDNSMLTYPYAEGPRYSMISGELFIQTGFEDALNIDRDSFNELHPHFMRAQSYIHSLLHDLIFPVTWGEEKARNKKRRDRAAAESEARFIQKLSKTPGVKVRSIQRIEKPEKGHRLRKPTETAVSFEARRAQIEIDRTHPLLQAHFLRRKHAALIEKLVVAFERSNNEATAARRRELFYKLLAEIFSDL